MGLLRYFSPMRALRDLREFLRHRQRHELGFLALSVCLTSIVIAGFVADSSFEKPYKRNITYIESWPLTRTDEEIRAQQKIDQAERERQLAELEERRAKSRAQFKKLDDQLNSWGI